VASHSAFGFENAILPEKNDTRKTGRSCMQISGCSAIVTGGTGGMGEATVRRLHAAGARVVVADVADEKGKALETELGVRYVHVDAGSEADVLAAIAEAEAMAPLRISVDVHGGPAQGDGCWVRTGARWGWRGSGRRSSLIWLASLT
jgi:NADPH:quinone reductase-like Zn-dependent oxidoreductase